MASFASRTPSSVPKPETVKAAGATAESRLGKEAQIERHGYQPGDDKLEKRRLKIWVHCEDNEQRSFFHEHATGTSVWELPEGPDDWLETVDPNTGESFYFNAATNLSTWEHPAESSTDSDWVECIDNTTGRTFYYHVQERKSVWQKPELERSVSSLEAEDTVPPLTKRMSSRRKPSRTLKKTLTRDDSTVPRRNFNVMSSTPSSSSSSLHGHARNLSTGSSTLEDGDTGDEDDGNTSNEETKSEEEDTQLEHEENEESLLDEDSEFAEGEYHDYVLKEGGGTTVFGRKSWKKRFMVLKHGELGWFRSYKEYAGGSMPLKGRWTSLASYRLEEMLQDNLGIRLIPVDPGAGERVWNIRCSDQNKKDRFIDAISPHIVSTSFVKSLDKVLSGRRFLSVTD